MMIGLYPNRSSLSRMRRLVSSCMKLDNYSTVVYDNVSSFSTWGSKNNAFPAATSNPQHYYRNGNICYFSGNVTGNGEDDGGIRNHDMFQQQMMEWKKEQDDLFGNDADNEDHHPNHKNENDLLHLVNQQRKVNLDTIQEELSNNNNDEDDVDWEARKEERDALYGFSDEERNAWTSTTEDHSHTLSPSLMKSIEDARNAQIAYEEKQLKDKEKKQKEWIDSANNKDDSNHELFTHLNPNADTVSMVDVGSKVATRRIARAQSIVVFPPEVMDAFQLVNSGTDMVGPKGPIFATAKIAGIMGAKRTSEMIPLCHPLPLEKVHIDIVLKDNRAIIECECRVTHKTGVEMEALQGATIAALTIYDMVKAVSHRVTIEKTQLLTKKGGKRTIMTASESQYK